MDMRELKMACPPQVPACVFGALGLLGLCQHQGVGATGGFDPVAGTFTWCAEDGFSNVLCGLAEAEVARIDTPWVAVKNQPISLMSPRWSEPVVLDWWINWDASKGRENRLKTWASNVTSLGLFQDLLSKVSRLVPEEDAVRELFMLSATGSKTAQLGLDSRSYWNQAKLGFSLNRRNASKLSVVTRPWAELLGSIGLQVLSTTAFVNSRNDSRNLTYYLWPDQLPAALARLAMLGVAWLGSPVRVAYHTQVVFNGSFKHLYYAVNGQSDIVEDVIGDSAEAAEEAGDGD